MLKEYEVHTHRMRDAQIFAAPTPEDGDYDDGWIDVEDLDPILDIVFAENEDDAVDMVSQEMEIHADNLYAVQHVASADCSRKRIEATSYISNEHQQIGKQQVGICVRDAKSGEEIYIEIGEHGLQVKSRKDMENEGLEEA